MNFDTEPYLSLVVAARNDNYGGDFIQRLQKFVDWNTHLLEKHRVDCEIIVVNWNPVSANDSLEKQISWPENRKNVCYRIITVPFDVHQKFLNENIRKTLPLYEYLAKNTGIRRAKGQFVLAMNPDILIAESIVKTISSTNLNQHTFYRANRLDFEESIHKPVRLWLKGFTYSINHSLNPLHYAYLQARNYFRCLWRLKSIEHEQYFKEKKWTVYYHNAEYAYHCNVSGDFMLMHKTAWELIKGNPENTYLPLHTDALSVVMAANSGLKEHIFSKPVLHQEHKRRFNAREKSNPENLKAYLYFQEEAQKMIKNKKATIYNNDTWGLRNFELVETEF